MYTFNSATYIVYPWQTEREFSLLYRLSLDTVTAFLGAFYMSFFPPPSTFLNQETCFNTLQYSKLTTCPQVFPPRVVQTFTHTNPEFCKTCDSNRIWVVRPFQVLRAVARCCWKRLLPTVHMHLLTAPAKKHERMAESSLLDRQLATSAAHRICKSFSRSSQRWIFYSPWSCCDSLT